MAAAMRAAIAALALGAFAVGGAARAAEKGAGNAAAGGGGAQAAPGAAPAADGPTGLDVIDQPAKDANVFAFDFAVPSSPALTLLDVDQSKVTQSNSLKPFVMDVLPGFLSGGGGAISLDIAPAAYLIPKSAQHFSDYGGVRALMFRTHVQGAAYDGVADADASKAKASKLAFGASSSLLNSSDPLLAALPGGRGSAWLACLNSGREVIQTELAALPPVEGEEHLRQASNALGDAIEDLQTQLKSKTLTEDQRKALSKTLAQDQAAQAAIDQDLKTKTAALLKATKTSKASEVIPACKTVADMAARLGRDLDIGAGTVWEGDPGKLAHLEHKATVLWISGRTSIGVKGPAADADWQKMADWADKLAQWFMLGASGRFGWNEQVSTGDKTTPQVAADTLNLWGGLERYTKSSRISAQLGWEKLSPRAASASAFDGSRMRWHVAWDQRLSETLGLWTTLSYGHANGTGQLKSDQEVRLSFTFSEPKAQNTLGQ